MLARAYYLTSDSKNQKPSILVLSGSVLSKPQISSIFTFALKQRGRLEIEHMLSSYQVTYYLESKNCHEIMDEDLVDLIVQTASFLCYKNGRVKKNKWDSIFHYESWNDSSASCFLFSLMCSAARLTCNEIITEYEWCDFTQPSDTIPCCADMTHDHYLDRVASFKSRIDWIRASDKVRWAHQRKQRKSWNPKEVF